VNKKFALFLFPKIYLLIIYSITFTCKKKWIGLSNIEELKKENKNWVYTLWHNCIAVSCWALKNQNLLLLVSNSKDGEMVSRAIKFMGNTTIRGSSSKGGLKALLQLVKKLKEGISIAITPDGPRGPRYKMQSGAINLAKRSGVPLVPFHIQSTRQWVLGSWVKHQIPKPFSTIVINIGKPFYISSKKLSLEEIIEIQGDFEKVMLDNVDKTQSIINKLLKNEKI